MGAVANGNTPATEITFDRVTQAIEADDWRYPNDVVFVPADLPEFGQVFLKALSKKTPIIVVYPDGRERLIPAPEPSP